MLSNAADYNKLEQLYAGDVTATQAWEILRLDPKAVLIDVRTVPEWTFVGLPDLSSLNKTLVKICWRLYPGMQVNPSFVEQVGYEVPEKDTPMLFLCRTGGRSLDAAIAMTEAGYTKCYNVVDGFEGSMNDKNHRGMTTGWKAENLPWEQN